MIYLFDEKIDRQHDYGWSAEKFAQLENEDILKSFSSYDFLYDEDLLRGKCDIILRHESFFSGAPTEKKQNALAIENRMNEACERGVLMQVIFAGSKSSRKIDEGEAFMPVSVFYQNLDFFVEKYRNGGWSLEDIVYGRNAELERSILDSLEEVNTQMVKDEGDFLWGKEEFPRVLIAQSVGDNRLDPPSFFNTQKCQLCTLRYDIKEDDPISDAFLHAFVIEEMCEKEYDKIYIPLCFGPTLSDYNGLRLALHIRTTVGVNQFTSLYIYSPVKFQYLIDNEYFDILKTLNVFLIDYSCKGLFDALSIQEKLSEESIRHSLTLVNLQPPKNYIDNHSIANEWAIYRWSQILGKNIHNEEISKITEKIDYNLYYKYLKTIYPPQEAEQLSGLDLNIKGITKEMTGEFLDEPSMLFVDDEAERGWYELFKSIIIFGVFFNYEIFVNPIILF